MANPMRARESAGASLMPSPTIAVGASFSKASTVDNFCSGRSSALMLASASPTRCPIVSAARRLSPVSSHGVNPAFFIAAMASTAPSFNVSATAKTPTTPNISLTATAVSPAACAFSNAVSTAGTASFFSRSHRRLVSRTREPFTRPSVPYPGSALKFFTTDVSVPRASAATVIARLTG